MSEQDLLQLLAGGVYNARIAQLVHDRGISFLPEGHDLSALRRAGADLVLLNAVESARHVTAQLPEHAVKPQPKRLPPPQITPPKSNPHQTMTIVPATSSIPQAVPAPRIRQQLPQTAASGPAIPVGTTITLANWQKYSQYMPFGMKELFQGGHFWKVPADLKVVVGPTLREKLPDGYTRATLRNSPEVRVVHLSNGHNDIENYAGGEPFPNPQEPDKGYKLLADLWFAYVPHLLAGPPHDPLTICSETSHAFVNCERLSYVYRQIAYNTDGKISPEGSKGSDYWYSEWLTVEEPEQLRYTTLLFLYPKDNQRPQELFTYIPSLRRWLRVSITSRCSPVPGTDYIQDDLRGVGFNGGLGVFDARFIQHQQILTLTGDYMPLGGDFPLNYYMPLGWPMPSWGKWQLRDVDVIDIRRLPGEQSNYCYGKRVIYEDSETHYALWEDSYDREMRFWKSGLVAQRMIKTQALGEVPGAFTSTVWDFQGRHLTNATTANKQHDDVLVDDDVPPEYQHFTQYSTISGLAQIMR
ncbi:MAG TPA: DUF1329 domain-containing protein [Candidatus Binataceae bacterium]|nr:DUF1329 domain-containing protein [Candidatus Binataceae bacterium]